MRIKISSGHAKILVGLDNALFVATKIIEKAICMLLKISLKYLKKYTKNTNTKDPNIKNLEEIISDKIGLNVSIKEQ